MPPERALWVPSDVMFGELELTQRKKVACISRRHGVPLHAGLFRDDWLDMLPFAVAAYLSDVTR